MATVALTFRKVRSAINSLAIDATITELHTAEAEITEHPVEDGAAIVDHVRPKADTIQIEGVISNTPIPAPGDALTRKTTSAGGVPVTYDSRGEIDGSRASKAYQTLLDIRDKSLLVDVFTPLRQYENMAMQSLTVPRNKTTGEAIRFTAVLKQVTVVSNKEETVDDKGKGKTDLGKKATTTAPEAEKDHSTLKQLADTDTGNGFLKKLGAR